MADVTVLIFHRAADPGEHELVRLLADVRGNLVERQSRLFRRAGAEVRLVDEWHEGRSFGEVLAALAPARGGLIVLSGGAVPLLQPRDVAQLVATAGSDEPRALTNNRYSSDICAISNASVLRKLPPLPSDNALPRWLEEREGYSVADLAARDRLALDLDTPLDVAISALRPAAPRWLADVSRDANLAVPRLDDVRAIATNPHAELLVFGRSSSRTLSWLERNVRCRVRFLAEERGMRAASPLAIGEPQGTKKARGPSATLGKLLDQSDPQSLASVVAGLADGAIIDSRVLLAHRLGADEAGWPSAVDRFASDLHRPSEITDDWLRELTKSAAESSIAILLGGHSLVGPGVPVLLGMKTP